MLIQLYPSNKLLQKSSNVEVFDEKLTNTVTEMCVLMRKLGGAGLAAPQVGLNQNLFLMELKDNADTDIEPLEKLEIVINPKIVSMSHEVTNETEGCLSFPGIFENVKRAEWVEVEFKNLKGHKVKQKLHDRLARCFQHEFEHLQGEVFIKHFSPLKRDIVKRKMTKINTLLGRA